MEHPHSQRLPITSNLMRMHDLLPIISLTLRTILSVILMSSFSWLSDFMHYPLSAWKCSHWFFQSPPIKWGCRQCCLTLFTILSFILTSSFSWLSAFMHGPFTASFYLSKIFLAFRNQIICCLQDYQRPSWHIIFWMCNYYRGKSPVNFSVPDPEVEPSSLALQADSLPSESPRTFFYTWHCSVNPFT